MIKKLLPAVKGYEKQTFGASFMIIIEGVLEIMIPFFMTKLINKGIDVPDPSLKVILTYGGLMILMAIFALISGALCARFAAVAGTGFASNLRNMLFTKVQDFSFANVDKFSSASIVTRLTTDVTNIQNLFTMIIRMTVRNFIIMITAFCFAVAVNAKLSLVFAVTIPLLAGVLLFIMIKAHPMFEKMLTKLDLMNAKVQENLIAIRVVKAFVKGEDETVSFEDSATALRKAQLAAEKIVIWNSPISQLIFYAAMVAVCFFGGKLIIGGQMKVGDLSGFLAYIGQILSSVMMLSMVFVSFIITRASQKRIVELLDEKIEIDDSDADPELTVPDGSVEFDGVNFSYAKDPGNLTLTNVDFKVRPGEMIGIIGGTGSAKTTLVQLIPRLYEVLSGSVKVGGHDVREYKLNNLRSAVAMVLQTNLLFSGTIEENLRWGDENASMEEIEAAAKAACAHDFIMSFPDGYATDLGQGGVNVSGGQKQRLCIARALLKKPKVVILDDSTSACDTATDAAIRKALRTQLRGTTTFIIAQRIASVAEADRVMVMDDGRLVAFDTPANLLKTNAIYREVYESQMKGGEEE
ncbi:MAG: ABC transporter ATP-binding protein/permease [Clostridiales bacterium]|nr:ABC transporter ATP-binding protein/permease [Clostridiales bacterium]